MARTKEFDPDDALTRAMELFWERGYEATSMADLVTHLGVAKASLYATFGGKHELFTKALQRYLDLTDPGILEQLSQPGPALPPVRALVERYAAASAEDERLRGCLVVNSAVELAGRDEEVARRVEASWAHLEVALTSALLRARAQGELTGAADPRALARFLLVFLQGVRVLGRAPGSAARLRDATVVALAALR
ncbi:TetR/AcrR family transcriptional regulator [Streptacidiphilus jiangxiensis]|uniref:TetR/AcrR family transcriptional regulator, transcriptional repressor for nem operon n=1 Tax=Streptacidiphilus jiangxiensis TaxID=235985 RepID=A0A1H7QIF0_STRJI|nr:TetR/AcrR family transcriptional regulator [Streptacidiphilus jiangxiensis]SEL47696.1 TetR/AcrR family transcriptional regulator, transcriptional repressor for nem operon [Streptacidiphilus jiangxiensis]